MCKQIIVINGGAGVGKDTFVEQFSKAAKKEFETDKEDVLNISTVDFVKEVAKYCGWDGTKLEWHRKFLSDLKDLLTRWDDVPYHKIKEGIEASNASFVFIHCREPEEIQKFVNGMGALTLLVRNNRIPQLTTNHADMEVENFKYNYIIDNDSTIKDLGEKAEVFLGMLLI